MNLLSNRGEQIYGAWTALTFVNSLLVLFFPLFGLLWGGVGVWQVDALALTAIASSVGLLIGVVRYRSTNSLVVLGTLLGAIPAPALVLTLIALIVWAHTPFSHPYIGSLGWWLTLLIYTVEILLSSSKLFQLRTSR
jgi:hypothetical protein